MEGNEINLKIVTSDNLKDIGPCTEALFNQAE